MGKLNYPSPCDKCAYYRPYCANFKKCEEYCKWVNTWWKHFRNSFAQAVQPKVITGNKFIYLHPDQARKYLMDGPCKACRAGEFCDTPCRAYLRWWDDRMQITRKKVGYEQE